MSKVLRSSLSRLSTRRSVPCCSNAYSTAAAATSEASTSTLPPSPPRGTRLYTPSAEFMSTTLNSLLTPRSCALLPTTIATALTAKSGVTPASGASHNSRLSFLGRRVLRMHLTLFLADGTVEGSAARAMSDEAISRCLETKELGAGVGRVWALESMMRWREVKAQNGEPSGLYKARGTALEAVVGAVYLQHGIQQSSHLFKTTILPHLSLPNGTQSSIEKTFKDAMASESSS